MGRASSTGPPLLRQSLGNGDCGDFNLGAKRHLKLWGSYRFKFTFQLSPLPGCVTLGTGLHLSEAILTCKVERITAPPRGGCEG